MPPTYIHQVGQQPGSTRKVLRSEVSDRDIADALSVIEQAIDAKPDRPVVAGSLPDGWLTIDEDSTVRKLRAVIWRGHRGKRVPVVTFGVALRHWPGSTALYRELLGGALAGMRQEPRAPWLAVRKESAWDQLPPDLAAEYDKYPAVLGWAWIERGRPATGMP